MDTEHAPPAIAVRRAGRSRRLIAVLLALGVVCTAVVRVGAASTRSTWLRTDDPDLTSVLRRGRAESPTFRALLERLEQTPNLIVYVRRGSLAGPTAAATQLVAASGG